jgi:hypothetical protein
MKVSKETLLDWEDNAAEIKYNKDGSVTYIFNEPGFDSKGRALTSSTTISKEEYKAAQ